MLHRKDQWDDGRGYGPTDCHKSKTPTSFSRRVFLRHAATQGAVLGAGGLVLLSRRTAAARLKRQELRITRIVVQEARGRRLTPVAPNAYAACAQSGVGAGTA